MAGTKVCGAALQPGDHLARGDFKGVEETTNIKVSTKFRRSFCIIQSRCLLVFTYIVESTD